MSSTALFVQVPRTFVETEQGEVLIAALDPFAPNLLGVVPELRGGYVVFAKCVAAPQARTDTDEAIRVGFRLVFLGAEDASWCYLIRGPGHRDPIDTVTLNVAAEVRLPESPPSPEMAVVDTPPGGPAQLFCRSSNGPVELTHIVLTAIPVDKVTKLGMISFG